MNWKEDKLQISFKWTTIEIGQIIFKYIEDLKTKNQIYPQIIQEMIKSKQLMSKKKMMCTL